MPLATATIKSEGVAMSPEFEVLYIDVSKEFNKIPTAEMKLIDGDVAKGKFDILEGDFFAPGKEIEIKLKYLGESVAEETVFKGIVVNQGLELNKLGTSLMVEMSDAAVRMTSVRKNAVFTKKTDKKIFEKLVQQNKLKVGDLAPTTLKHDEMVQYYATDWDFLVSRAEANGQLVQASDGEISTIVPAIDVADMTLELGRDNIFDFDLQVNALDQLEKVESVAWDIAGQKISKAAKGAPFAVAQGNYKLSDIAQAVGGTERTLVHPVALDPKELKAWADAQIIKSRLSLIRGRIEIPGEPKVKVGQVVHLKGVSKRFSGKALITGVRHQVTPEGWRTNIQIGMEADWFSAQTKVVDTQAAGLLPGVNGLQIGLVVAAEKDPKSEFRIKVNIPAFDPKQGTVWARLTSVDAGAERGYFFRPEVGDEVIVGFLNDDPRQAIVLGAVHSSANQPPLPISPKNELKGIITKKKYQLLFDEENEIITLATSEKNSIAINEKEGIISIQDANGNQIEMSKDGLVIDSAKNCKIISKGDFEIAAKGNVKIGGKEVDLI